MYATSFEYNPSLIDLLRELFPTTYRVVGDGVAVVSVSELIKKPGFLVALSKCNDQ